MAAFSDADIGTLDEIAETILPRTRTPGAKDAGAGAFMATFVSDCYTARQQAVFRAGLADIDKRAGGRFLSLTPEARTALLRTLDAEAKARNADVTETGTPEEGDAALLHDDQATGHLRLLHLQGRCDRGAAIRRCAGTLRRRPCLRSRYACMGTS